MVSKETLSPFATALVLLVGIAQILAAAYSVLEVFGPGWAILYLFVAPVILGTIHPAVDIGVTAYYGYLTGNWIPFAIVTIPSGLLLLASMLAHRQTVGVRQVESEASTQETSVPSTSTAHSTILVSYWRRVGSWILDYMAVALVMAPIQLALGLSERSAPGVVLLICMIYRAIADANWDGSIGRWITGYRLLSETGEPPSLQKLIIRNIILYFLLILLPFGIIAPFVLLSTGSPAALLGLPGLIPLISYGGRTLFDRVYDTYAVKVDCPPSCRFGRWVYTHRRAVTIGLVTVYLVLILLAALAYLITTSDPNITGTTM